MAFDAHKALKHLLCTAGAQREAAEALQEQSKQREQLQKADAALSQLREQLALAKDEIAVKYEDIKAAVAEKDGHAQQAADISKELVGVRQELSHAKAANAQVLLCATLQALHQLGQLDAVWHQLHQQFACPCGSI